MSKTLLLHGATGETGKNALLAALSSSHLSSVHSLGRRSPVLPPSVSTLTLTPTTVNFDLLLTSLPSSVEIAKFSNVVADTVLIALGTTRAAAGGLKSFYKIDREYVVAAARPAKVDGKKQRLLYCSANAASSSSFIPYCRSKGLTEEALAALDYDETIIFRPGMLNVPGGRVQYRFFESMAMKITGFLSNYFPSVGIKTTVLGEMMIKASMDGIAGLKAAGIGKKEVLNGHEAWVLSNADALKYARTVV